MKTQAPGGDATLARRRRRNRRRAAAPAAPTEAKSVRELEKKRTAFREALRGRPLPQYAQWRWEGPWWDVLSNVEYLTKRVLGLASLVLLGQHREHVPLRRAMEDLRNGDILLFSGPSNMTFFTMNTVTHVAMVVMVPGTDPATGMEITVPHVWEASTPNDGAYDVISGETGRSGARMVPLEDKLQVYQALWGRDFPQWRPLVQRVRGRGGKDLLERPAWADAPWAGLGREWFERTVREFHFEPSYMEMLSSAFPDKNAGPLHWLMSKVDDPHGFFCTQLVARTLRAMDALARDDRDDRDYSLSDFYTGLPSQDTLAHEYAWAHTYHIV